MAQVELTEKRCPRCGRVLPVGEFHANKKSADGLQSYCNDCTREYNREYYNANFKRKDWVRWKDRPKAEQLAHARDLFHKRMEAVYSSPALLQRYRERTRAKQAEYYKRRKEKERLQKLIQASK